MPFWCWMTALAFVRMPSSPPTGSSRRSASSSSARTLPSSRDGRVPRSAPAGARAGPSSGPGQPLLAGATPPRRRVLDLGRRDMAVNTAVQHAEWAEESWTAEATTEELLAYFDGWDPSLLERIRRCSTLLRGAVFVRRPLDDWAFGRIALLGDSAHAMEPWQAQGAAQAIEDAYVLAECLAGSEGEVEAALERYATIRMTRSDGAPALVGAGRQRLLSSRRRGTAPARRGVRHAARAPALRASPEAVGVRRSELVELRRTPCQ